MVASQGLARLDPQQLHQIFSSFRQSQDQALREHLVLAHAPRAAALARRFANRGEPVDDLVQVATIGLLKAVDRFDPTRGVQFSTYATATILGELRRHFRDRFWTIRVSRGLRELNHRLMRAGDRLAQELGRTPTVAEMARECGVGLERALEAFEVGRAYRPASLDTPAADGQEETGRPGADDPALQGVEDRVLLERAIHCLPERLQATIRMRYYEGLRQAEVARRIGTSQVAVSRIERQALDVLRAMVSWHDDLPASPSNGQAKRSGNGHTGTGHMGNGHAGNGHAGNGNGNTGHRRRPRVQPRAGDPGTAPQAVPLGSPW